MVEVPTFGWVADVCCVKQQRQSFGLVNAEGQKNTPESFVGLYRRFKYFHSVCLLKNASWKKDKMSQAVSVPAESWS